MAVKATGVISLMRVDDGDSSFVWVKYADDKYGANISDTPEGKMFFGIAYNKTTSSESNTPGDYTWSAMYDLGALDSKADKTQIIQLTNQWTQTTDLANGHTGLIANLGTDINLRVTKADLISQFNIQADNILIQTGKLYLDVASVTMTTAYVNDLNTKTLTAVYADIATLKTKVLTADVITSTMLKSDTALISKIFVTDANVGVLTAKSAFVNSIKAIDIAADRITAGTLNAANINIINLNASKIATGTITGVNSSWNLNTGTMNFKNPTTGDNLYLNQGRIEFQNGAQGRYLEYNAEGLHLVPFVTNTGTSKNTMLHLEGGGTGSYQYIQFTSGSGISQRVEAVDHEMVLHHGVDGAVHVRRYGQDDTTGKIITAKYETRHVTGKTLIIARDTIDTVRTGTANIYVRPSGAGVVVAGGDTGDRYNVVASDFVKQSTRTSKTGIKPIKTKGLDVINRLTPVSYKKKDKVSQGIIETELGFISEDSLEVATVDGLGIYDSHIVAYLVKAMQELDVEVRQNKQTILEMENTK